MVFTGGIQAALKRIRKRMPQRKGGIVGKIINASSPAGQVGNPGLAVYGAIWFAIYGITQPVAKDQAKSGIAGNAYC